MTGLILWEFIKNLIALVVGCDEKICGSVRIWAWKIFHAKSLF